MVQVASALVAIGERGEAEVSADADTHQARHEEDRAGLALARPARLARRHGLDDGRRIELFDRWC